MTVASTPSQRLRRVVLGAVVGGTVAFGGLSAIAPMTASADPCGYYRTKVPEVSYYNHCGSRPAAVFLTVEFGFDRWTCLPPGTTNLTSLGKAMGGIRITYAKSNGDPCSS